MVIKPGRRGEDLMGKQLSRPTAILSALTALVLLLACSNIANLLLSQATARDREMTMRISLGAGRGRLVRQLLTEGMLLATFAGVLGLGATYLLYRFMPVFLQGLLPMTFDWQVAAFTLSLVLGTTLMFGRLPAWQASAGQGSSRATQGRARSKTRAVLVGVQVALASVMLIAGGLLWRTLSNLSSVRLGVDTEHLLLVATELSENRYPEAKRAEAQRQLAERIERLPGVRAVGFARDAVASGSSFLAEFYLDGGKRRLEVGGNIVDDGFFRASGIPILRGRGFDSRDNQGSRRVAVINERLARLAFPGEDPIGKVFNGDTEIIGICGVSHLGQLRDRELAAMYAPFAQVKFWGQQTIYIRTRGLPNDVAADVRKTMPRFDRDLPVISMRTQTEQVAAALTQERVFNALTGAFAIFSMMLACAGVYGVTQFSVARRTKEIGIRLALGAQRQTVMSGVMREAFLPVSIGLVCGIALSIAGAHAMAALLYGVAPGDLGIMFGAGGFVLASAVVAIWQPALRASRISPLTALRYE